MDIPLRTEALRSIDTDSRPGVDSRNPADAGGFGELFAELRQRDIDRDDDRDPPTGAEAAFAGQPVPVPARASTPAEAESPAEGASESAATDAIAAPDASDGTAATTEATAAPLTAPATSPESFAALLESSANDLATAVMQTPATDALAAATGTAPAQPAQAALPPAVTATIAPPLQSPAWPAAFNNTMRVLVTDQTQVARLQLTPGDLGPVDVRIAISEHRAEIAFAVSSPEAKAAIQQALPQLRETFAAGGLQLGDATFGESPRGSSANGDQASRSQAWPGDGRGGGESAVPLPEARTVGLIDLYA